MKILPLLAKGGPMKLTGMLGGKGMPGLGGGGGEEGGGGGMLGGLANQFLGKGTTSGLKLMAMALPPPFDLIAMVLTKGINFSAGQGKQLESK